MEGVKFRIHPLFLVFGVASFCVNLGAVFVSYLLSALLHELGHAFVAQRLGYRLQQISLLPFGAELSLNDDKFVKNDEIKIAIAGPLVNVILIVIFVALWWIFPVTYYYTDIFVFANAVTFVFNLLPVFPLDGGRVFRAIVSKRFDPIKTEKIVSVTAITLSLAFFCVFLLSLFVSPIYSLAIASIFMITGAFNFNKNAVYKRLIFVKDLQKNFKKGCNINLVAVSHNMPLFKLIKFINPQTYTIFIVYDEKNNLQSVILEKNLDLLFTKYESYTLLKELKTKK